MMLSFVIACLALAPSAQADLSLEFFSSEGCFSQGTSLPGGLVSNPMTFSSRTCKTITTDGFGLEAACAPQNVVNVTLYPNGCNGAPGETIRVSADGYCSGVGGAHPLAFRATGCSGGSANDVKESQVCATTYRSIVNECLSFGEQLHAQFMQNPNSVPDMNPDRLCNDPCFAPAKLSEVKAAVAAGCFESDELTLAHGNATLARSIGQKIDAFFDSVRDAACSKNGDTYCETFYMQAASAVSAAGSSKPSPSVTCPILSRMGCCLKNAIDQDAHIRELNPSMPTGIQILGFAADCNVTIPSDLCPGSGTANFGTGGLSAACSANPIVQTCTNFGEALYQQIVRHQVYHTTIAELDPETLCSNPCFTSNNLQLLKEAVRDGCFGQALAAGGGSASVGMTPAEMVRASDAFLTAIEDFGCVKNHAGSYCATYFETGQRLGEQMASTGCNSPSPPRSCMSMRTQVCDNIHDAGCCGATIVASDASLRTLFPDFPGTSVLISGVNNECPHLRSPMGGPVCPSDPGVNFNDNGAPSSDGSSSDDGDLSAGDDAGIAIGVLAFIGLAAVLGLYVVKPRCDNKGDSGAYEMGYTSMSGTA